MRANLSFTTGLFSLAPFAVLPGIVAAHLTTSDGEHVSPSSARSPADDVVTWPTPGCDPGVWQCIQEHPDAVDLSVCGNHREVLMCMDSGACSGAPGQPLPLTRIDASALIPLVRDFDESCVPGGYTWCSMNSVRVYAVPGCLPEPPSLADIVAAVGARDRRLRRTEFAWGRVYDRASLVNTPFFSTSYSPVGPALLAAIEALTGDTRVEAWFLSEEVRCHNCSEFEDTSVLWYPEAGMVIVLRGTHGYDS